MLFGYPTAATQDNWFHDCLCEILQTIHTSKQRGQSPPTWPTIIPETHRTILRSRHGLRDRLNKYQAVIDKLNESELNQVINAVKQQNEIASLLAGNCDCETVDDLPQPIRHPVADLFAFAFKLLTDLGIRDRQYKVIYNMIPGQVCPFCGCEYFDAPGAPREALDHYLVEKDYPFAAANLHNLVPMGNKCNSRYKYTQNILYSDDGTRRRSYYPYNEHHKIQISLENSQPFGGSYKFFPVPLWQIDFQPNSEETATWDTVFHIRTRYIRDILNPEFKSWLREFRAWCLRNPISLTSNSKFLHEIERFSDFWATAEMGDRAFLKASVFRMLHQHCQQGNQRLLAFVKRVVDENVV